MKRELEGWIVRDMLARTACALPCRKDDEPTELKLEHVEAMVKCVLKHDMPCTCWWGMANR